MEVSVLDRKREATSLCYLCKVDLAHYISAVPDSYRDFDVQRGIVANRYLDHLADTIWHRRHIPPIVLVSDQLRFNGESATIEDFRILDGLQRTHRLRTIWNMLELMVSSRDKQLIAENPGKFARRNSQALRDCGGDTKLLKRIVNLCDPAAIFEPSDFFGKNHLWLEIWTGLDRSEQIEKMLLLNAGHKSVNIKHQLELLFLSTLFRLEDIAPEGVTFVREKDISALQYSKTRVTGQYHFAHIISALVALSAGQVVNTNSDFVSDLQSNQSELVELVEEFSLQLVAVFVGLLFQLDQELFRVYGEIGTRWLGREVVLIGFFGAIGALSEEEEISRTELLQNAQENLPQIVANLSLEEFEMARNAVELNKVNVGNVNKRAVFRAVYELLQGRRFSGWNDYFGA